MKTIKQQHVPYNTGWAGEMNKGQVIRITGTTTVDFVCMRLQNLIERFDQARTKVYNMKLFVTTGDKLMGRNNQHMMTILATASKAGPMIYRKGCAAATDSSLPSRKGGSENTIRDRSPRSPITAATKIYRER